MGAITNRIGSAKDDFNRYLYFYEDIERLIAKLESYIAEGHTDAVPTTKRHIADMLRANGVETKDDCTAKEYAAQLKSGGIPSVKSFPDRCWEHMLEFNIAYVSPKAYMERLVDELGDAKYKKPGATVRVRLLQQFLSRLDYLSDTRFYSKALQNILRDDYRNVIEDIDDRIFTTYLGKTHRIYPYKALSVLLEVYRDKLYSDKEKDPVLTEMVMHYDRGVKDLSARELLEYLYKNNHRQIRKDDGTTVPAYYPLWERDENLLLEINAYLYQKKREYTESIEEQIKKIDEEKDHAKRFEYIVNYARKYGITDKILTTDLCAIAERKTRRPVNGRLAGEDLAKRLFEILKERTLGFPGINKYLLKIIRALKTQTNQEFDKKEENARDRIDTIEILSVCHNLAEGYYRSNAKMKEALYLFAFAFDMTADPEKATDNPFKDVRKNLFEDFYSDNILRYVEENFYMSGGDVEPSGITVQYKNFAEIVFLYWLNKDSEKMTPDKKYKAACEMIGKLSQECARAEKKADREGKRIQRKTYKTEVYRKFFEGNDPHFNRAMEAPLLSMEEKAFADFLKKHYDIDTGLHYTGKESFEMFENGSTQRTAENIFRKRMQATKELHYGPLTSWYYPVEFYQCIFKELHGGKAADPRTARLTKLVEKVDAQIFDTFNRKEPLFTRSRYMYLYFNWFVQSRFTREEGNENHFDQEGYTANFDDFYDEYTGALNRDLKECSYQLFSHKNLIDMMLLYSAFILLRTDISLPEESEDC